MSPYRFSALVVAASLVATGGCSFVRNLDDLTGGDAAPDASNTCATDCLGGACLAGVCQPITLIDGRPRPWGIAVDDTHHVYWSEIGTSTVYGAAYELLPDAGDARVIESDAIQPMWLFIGLGNLYWASSIEPGAIGRCPLGGSGCVYEPGLALNPPGSIVAEGFESNDYVNNPDRVVADSSGIYWTNAGTSRDSDDGTVVVCPSTGCGKPPPFVLATALPRPRGIAVDAAYVYWVNDGASTNPTSGTVYRISKEGGTAQKIADAQGTPGYIAVDDVNAYWTNSGTGQVMVWPKSGGDVSVFAANQDNAWDIAVDASGVYWTTWGPSGTVAMCPTSGCDGGVTVLASNQNEPYGIALDTNAVYYTSYDPTNGAVLEVAKPAASTSPASRSP